MEMSIKDFDKFFCENKRKLLKLFCSSWLFFYIYYFLGKSNFGKFGKYYFRKIFGSGCYN